MEKKVRHNCIRQYLMGFDTRTISILTNVRRRSVQRFIKRYNDTGTYLTQSELFGDERGRPPIITPEDLLVLCAIWSYDFLEVKIIYIPPYSPHLNPISNFSIWVFF